ncbi:unnamed protein product [Clonostachys rosea]|uniref:Uncharacterized protein n=1 Tax=Bionectria ochroleuca TaxID=29856 RepID=A0ABY6TXS2_BIOOC|nr:unnamed protein product [Clonostachys rosea]
MSTKVVFISGANTGIGFETAKAFIQSPNPYYLFLGSRSAEKGNEALERMRADNLDVSQVEVVQLDLASDESIKRAVDVVKTRKGRLDILINNAGAGFDNYFIQGKMSLRDCFNQAYDVNVSGANVMTWEFVPLLLKSSTPRILFVAGLSQMTAAAESYFPTPPQPAGWPKNISFETIGYRCSKTAMSMLMLDWHHKLKEDGVKVFSVSPGTCATNLGGLGEEVMAAIGGVHPREGGERLLAVAEGNRDADAGKILDKTGFLPW